MSKVQLVVKPNISVELIELGKTKIDTIGLKSFKTGLKLIDRLPGLELIWYTQQIQRLGAKKKPITRHPRVILAIYIMTIAIRFDS